PWRRRGVGWWRGWGRYSLRLVEARWKEGRTTRPYLDPIFPGVRFVSPYDRNNVIREKVALRDVRPADGSPAEEIRYYFRAERDAKNAIQKGGRSYLAGPDGDRLEGMRFVAEDDKYHAGRVARRMMDMLPQEATQVVVRLAAWQPQDLRLCWLLGELFNALGHVEAAAYLLGPKDPKAAGWGGD